MAPMLDEEGLRRALPEAVRIDVVGRSILARLGHDDIPAHLSAMKPISWPEGWFTLGQGQSGFHVIVDGQGLATLAGAVLKVTDGIALMSSQFLDTEMCGPFVKLLGHNLPATLSFAVQGMPLHRLIDNEALADIRDARIAAVTSEIGEVPFVQVAIDPDWVSCRPS